MNSKFSCILVEDEALQMQMLAQAVKQQAGINIVGKAATLNEAYQMIIKLKPQMAIMDVQFLGGTIYDLFQRLQQAKVPIPTTILVSAHDKQAVDALNLYKDQVVFFIIKRDLDEYLPAAIDRAVARVHQGANDTIAAGPVQHRQILIRSQGYMTLLPTDHILYARTHNGQSSFITKYDDIYEVNYSLNRLIQTYPQLQLIRINRNVAVAKEKIYRINIGDHELEVKHDSGRHITFCIGLEYYRDMLSALQP